MSGDYSNRSVMSYRQVLRTIPKPLRRRWLSMRLRYDAPRVAIGSAWLPSNVRRGFSRRFDV